MTAQQSISGPLPRSVLAGIAFGALAGLAAAAAALASSGAGHGDYVAARALFPMPMLLTRLDAPGWLLVALVLVQYPLYGAFIVWSRRRHAPSMPILLALLHLAVATACFAGALPDFS